MLNKAVLLSFLSYMVGTEMKYCDSKSHGAEHVTRY